ncbi:MAG TPA: serine/threonine-protein kinase [Kofleriaceae bacterium]
MADARCSTCDGPVANGTHCEACAGVAATQAANATPTKAGGARGAKAAKSDPLIGAEVIGQYVIRSLLGKGGMGAVYLADQPSVGRRAVIKVLHPVHSRDAGSQARFETEARAASQLNHPNIVTIYNYGAMSDGTLFLAMEHLDGQTLEQLTAKRRLPLPRAVHIVAQIADALGEAHRNGVVHRDVKPSNVMLVARGQSEDVVKVLDFGIAHVDGTRLTETGAVCGTPTYMSPEQIRGKTIDGRSDLYALGCMLFELVTGQPPFAGGNTLGLAYMHVHEPPPLASEVAPKANVPAALDVFLARVLAKEPADRPRHAEAFRDELRAAIAEPAPAGAAAKLESKPVPKAEAKSAESAAKADSKPAAKAEAKPESKAESKPAKTDTPKPRAKPTPPRGTRDTGTSIHRGLAALATAVRGSGSLFRRRKSFGQRLMARVRSIGRRPSRRWGWIIVASVITLSLVGVGWFVMTRSDDKQNVGAPAKLTPAKPPAKSAPKKPARTKRPPAGSGSRTTR